MLVRGDEFDVELALPCALVELDDRSVGIERELANRNDEIDLLKKAERFFQRKK